MRATCGNLGSVAAEIGGQFRPGTDRFVRRPVGAVCKALWPIKTDAEVATIVGCDPRNARRYLSGELSIPAKLLTAINIELTRE